MRPNNMRPNFVTTISNLVVFCILISTASVWAQRKSVEKLSTYKSGVSTGLSALSTVRAKMLAKYDADKNGRLDAVERLAMRADVNRKEEGRGRGRQRWQPPKRWFDLYDRNKDGEMDEGEISFGFSKETERIMQPYDKDGDGELDAVEKGHVKADIDAGKYQDVDRWIASRLAGIDERGGRRGGGVLTPRQSAWQDFDFDKDGKASPDEIAAIRKYENK